MQKPAPEQPAVLVAVLAQLLHTPLHHMRPAIRLLAALPYLNQIRERAGAPLYGDPGFPIPGSKDDMAEKILDERGFELVFEFMRRPDLIRFGKFVEYTNAYLQEAGVPNSVTEDMKYLPYPLTETYLNGEMSAANSARYSH